MKPIRRLAAHATLALCLTISCLPAAAGEPMPGPRLPQETERALAEFNRVLANLTQNYVEPVTEAQLFALAIAGLYEEAGESPPEPGAQKPDTVAFIDAMERIKKEHPQLGDQRLIRAATRRMAMVDERSRLMSQEELGPPAGPAWIGVELKKVGTDVVVVRPVPGLPAAGHLRRGDRIEAIDGERLINASLEEAMHRLYGPAGTAAQLSIVRSGAHALTISIPRTTAIASDVECPAMREGIGYVRVSRFRKETSETLIRALTNLEQVAPLRGLVLDLRDNTGGLLGAAAGMTNLFLSGGLIVATEGRGPDTTFHINASATFARYPEVPMIVLINETTASGAELVAAALQDHHRARIAGSSSAGMGILQTIFPTGQDYLKLTTARLMRPSGRPLSEGVTPDIVIKEVAHPSENAWHPCGAALGSTEWDEPIELAAALVSNQAKAK